MLDEFSHHGLMYTFSSYPLLSALGTSILNLHPLDYRRMERKGDSS